MLKREVLRPNVLEAAIRKAVERLEAESVADAAPSPLGPRLEEVERQIDRLTAAIAAGGELASLIGRLQQLETERGTLAAALAAAERQATATRFERPQLDQALRERLADWRGLLGRQVQATRQILGKVLAGRIELHPVEDGKRCEVRIPITLGGLLSGAICPQGLASPAFASWNHLERWLRAVDGLRQAA